MFVVSSLAACFIVTRFKMRGGLICAKKQNQRLSVNGSVMAINPVMSEENTRKQQRNLGPGFTEDTLRARSEQALVAVTFGALTLIASITLLVAGR
jgi:hypothetical protein